MEGVRPLGLSPGGGFGVQTERMVLRGEEGQGKAEPWAAFLEKRVVEFLSISKTFCNTP